MAWLVELAQSVPQALARMDGLAFDPMATERVMV
jgi:hypothetical protein